MTTVTSPRFGRAQRILLLDDPFEHDLLEADPSRIDRGPFPLLIDEWQRFPRAWDLVRRSVDRDGGVGRFILTGSATPTAAPQHSGAGRIVTVRMRPLTIAERGLTPPTVSLAGLLNRDRPGVGGVSPVTLGTYATEIVASGFPAIRVAPGRPQRALLDGYISRIVERDVLDQGHRVRRPSALLAWLRAYAAATATTASYQRIARAAAPGDGDPPARSTINAYRSILEQLWILDPVPAWTVSRNPFVRIGQSPKHHLTDPALAARLLRATAPSLLRGPGAGGTAGLLGQLFESLVTLSVRVYAQRAEAAVYHLRSQNGDREVDLIVERDDGRVVALEVKLSPVVRDDDVRHLHWLAGRLGDDLIDSVVVTSGREAYRRPDGIAVVPAALLGP